MIELNSIVTPPTPLPSSSTDMSTYESTNFLFKNLFTYVPESAVKYTDGLINKWKSYSEVDSGRDVQMAEEMNKFVKKRCMHTVLNG